MSTRPITNKFNFKVDDVSDKFENIFYNNECRGGPSEYSLNLHFGAFIPCIYSFGSEEQIKKWAPLAETMGIVGAYAQTELGHG